MKEDLKEAFKAIKFTLIALSPIIMIFVLLAVIGFLGAIAMYQHAVGII